MKKIISISIDENLKKEIDNFNINLSNIVENFLKDFLCSNISIEQRIKKLKKDYEENLKKLENLKIETEKNVKSIIEFLDNEDKTKLLKIKKIIKENPDVFFTRFFLFKKSFEKKYSKKINSLEFQRLLEVI
ncbi:MAG: hypothetical protein ACP6IY_18910 [Promethearchaeia archaeon]